SHGFAPARRLAVAPPTLPIQRLEHLVEPREVGAPLRLGCGYAGQAVDNGAALLQQLACFIGIIDGLERADLMVAHRQVALPPGISRVTLGQRLGDDQTMAIAGERLL